MFEELRFRENDTHPKRVFVTPLFPIVWRATVTKTRYRQCLLRKQIDNRTSQTQVTWLPEQFAILNRTLKLRGSQGTWIGGWVVRVTGSESVPESRLPDAHDAVRSHRRRTGDAEPQIGRT